MAAAPTSPSRGFRRVPAPVTSLIGRDQLLALVGSRIVREDVRLVTLTGPGGAGKTRLAIQLATSLPEAFTNGVVFVPLDAIRAPELVAATTLQTLRSAMDTDSGAAPSSDTRPAADQLAGLIGDARLLLILDTFEHLLPAATAVLELLTRCPHVTVLVTSRAPLQIPGEHEFAVPPLASTTPPSPATASAQPPPAVHLFVERARAAVPSFTLTPENAGLVEEICSRLDGLPLAIELAAVRVKVFSLETLRERLSRRLALLSGGRRDLGGRHQTLRETIAWSYALLDEGPRRVFRRLSVFAGGCTLEQAAAVLADDPDIDLALDGITTLIDHSLLVREDVPGRESRYRMLETIREYAEEELVTAGESTETRRLHARTYFQMVASLYPRLAGPQQVELLDRVEAELPNLRAALGWLLAEGESEDSLRLTAMLYRLWLIRGHHDEGLRWIAEALSLDPTARTEARARALNAGGSLHWFLAEYARAEAMQQEALAIWEVIRDPYGMGDTLHNLASIAWRQHEWDRAEILFAQALAWKKQLPSTLAQVWTLHNWGIMAHMRDDLDRAEANLSAALAITREHRDQWGLAHAARDLAVVLRRHGRYTEALPLTREALTIFATLGFLPGVMTCINSLGVIAAACGQPDRAAHLFGAAEAIHQRIGDGVSPTAGSVSSRHVAAAQAALAGPDYDRAFEEGANLTLDEAIAEAHAVTPATDASVPAGVPVDLPAPPAASPAAATRPANLDGLTEREVEVLRLIANGLTNREIAGQLVLSVATVERHISNLYAKINARRRADATAYALRHDLT